MTMSIHNAMQLFTRTEMPERLPEVGYADSIMLLGSCFADGMGQRLTAAKFRCDVNPFGTLYNPFSITKALRRIMSGHEYGERDLVQYGGLWHSMMHHGSFSTADRDGTLHLINNRLVKAHDGLHDVSLLILTLGSAWVYSVNDDGADTGLAQGTVVGNCHKMPESWFCRRRLTVEEIVADCTSLFDELFASMPRLRVLLTVSPIRHVRDGLHGNQLSKATLLLAIDELSRRHAGRVYYFPAYEILNDELRDYRFYADDMVHPSAMASDYVWQRFCEHCLAKDAQEAMRNVNKIEKMMSHRPLHPEGDEYRTFLCQIMLSIESLCAKYPYFDFTKELEECRTRLNILQR